MASPQLRYFSCCPEKGVATRYGTARPGGANSLIGAVQDENTGEVTFRPEEVVAIPADEVNRFRREYARQLRDGCLVERSKEDHDLFLKAQQEESEKVKAETPEEEGSSASSEEQEGSGEAAAPEGNGSDGGRGKGARKKGRTRSE